MMEWVVTIRHSKAPAAKPQAGLFKIPAGALFAAVRSADFGQVVEFLVHSDEPPVSYHECVEVRRAFPPMSKQP